MRKLSLFLGLLFLCAIPSQAQTLLRHSTLCSTSTTGTCTFSSNTAGSTIIFVGHAGISTLTNIPTLTDSAGNTYALKVATAFLQNSGFYHVTWEADNIAASAGTNTLTVTPNTGQTFEGEGFEYTGLAANAYDQTMGRYNSSVSGANSCNSSATLQTIYSNELLIEDMANGSQTVTPTDGSSSISTDSNSYLNKWTSRIVSSVGAQTATGTPAGLSNCLTAVDTFRVSGSNPPADPTFNGPLVSGYLPSSSCTPVANIWITDTMTKVLQGGGLPPTVPCSLTLYGTQNEIVDFQVHFHDTGSGTAGLKVTVGNFVQSSPNSSTINCATLGQCVVHRDAYMNVTAVSSVGPAYYGMTGNYPDRLIPAIDPYWGQTTNAFPFTVGASNNQSTHIDIHIPTNAPSGYYSGTVTVQTGCPGSCVTVATFQVILGVVAWPSSGFMPSTTTLKTEATNSGYDEWCVVLYDVDGTGADGCSAYPDGSGTNDLAICQIYEDLAVMEKDHRWDQGNEIGGGCATSSPGAGSTTAYVSLGAPVMSGGARHGGTYVPLLNASVNTTRAIAFHGAACATLNNIQSAFVAQSWGTAGNLPGYDYLFDEPSSGANWTTINTTGPADHVCNSPAIQELVTTNIATATTNSALASIDIMVPQIISLDPITGSNLRSTYNTWLAGNANNCGSGANMACGTRMIWQYQTCLSAGTCRTLGSDALGVPTPFPNVHVDGKPAANRAMEWLSYVNNLSGELYFESGKCNTNACGVTGSTHDPCVSVFNEGAWGDGTLVYPGSTNAASTCYVGAGVTTPIFVPSMRLKLMRDGVQDYEILNELNTVGQGAFVTSTLANWLTNSYTFETSGAGLMLARNTLLAKMQSLTYSNTSVPAAPSKVWLLTANK